LLPELEEMLAVSVSRVPTTVLTNATLFRGKRREVLERFAGEPNFSLQVSVDGGIPELHDLYWGPGSWKRAMESIGIARNLGIRVRIGTSQTPENRAGIPVLRGDTRGFRGSTGRPCSAAPDQTRRVRKRGGGRALHARTGAHGLLRGRGLAPGQGQRSGGDKGAESGFGPFCILRPW
jgi:radical SAM family protein